MKQVNKDPSKSGNGSHPVIDNGKLNIPLANTSNKPKIELSSLRLPQNYAETVGVKKRLDTVPVDRPGRQVFFRVHPEESYRTECSIFVLEAERKETYLVAGDIALELPGEAVPKILFTTIDRHGVIGLWPVRLPGEDGRLDNWSKSALEGAYLAMKSWISIRSNMGLGAYEIHEAVGNLSEPEWPQLSFQEIVNIAFRDRFIDSLDHPVIRQLRGEF